ncbi:hypothetical protein [Mammaliicoccus sciuri]|uniref:hypothetical protein n=1 Tax=Mammaliicoccus sciuri TaxID=1296 RepID=UPI0021CF49AD|nr:hypothetical protein [Mammaliicoccus sciuri]UXV29417.1 hypothetical protein MUA76_14130 [Mammaliicoccus sciuri]
MIDDLKNNLWEWIEKNSDNIFDLLDINKTTFPSDILNIISIVLFILTIMIFIISLIVIIYIVSLIAFPIIAIIGYFKDRKKLYDEDKIELSRKGKGKDEVYITYYIWQRQKKKVSEYVLSNHTQDNLVAVKSKWVLFPYKKKVWGYL